MPSASSHISVTASWAHAASCHLTLDVGLPFALASGLPQMIAACVGCLLLQPSSPKPGSFGQPLILCGACFCFVVSDGFAPCKVR